MVMMDRDTKRFLGKILGEIFRIQRYSETNICSASDAQIYALLHGFEGAVDDIFEQMGDISSEKLQIVMDILEPIWFDKEKLAKFKGFYDIERELQEKGIDRPDAYHILTFLKANGQYTSVIEKMDSSNSPVECRTFEITEWDA
jgi:hypothetical protein